MSEKKEWTKFKLYIPDKKRFEFYQKILKELGYSTSSRIWFLIESDLEQIIAVTKIIKKQKVKKNGK